MENIINYLKQFGSLSSKDCDLIKTHAKCIELKKEDYFSEAGKIAKNIAFVNKGILRVCYYNNLGEEITRYFIDENNFAVDLTSYNYQIPSSEYVQAIDECQLFVFSSESMLEFANSIPDWNEIVNKITAHALMEKINRISPMLSEDATSRYFRFLEKYPLLANRIPLSYLASYIGITQSSLSRIRKSIV